MFLKLLFTKDPRLGLWKQSYHDDSPRCFDDAKAQRVVSRLKNQHSRFHSKIQESNEEIKMYQAKSK